MGIYTRYKKDPNGFRKLVELLESTPPSRRQKMIDIGMEEDADYTERALSLMISFDDIISLSDEEMAELMGKAPPRTIAFAIESLEEEKRRKFLAQAPKRVAYEVDAYLGANIGPSEAGAARLKLIEITRELERSGRVRIKSIA